MDWDEIYQASGAKWKPTTNQIPFPEGTNIVVGDTLTRVRTTAEGLTIQVYTKVKEVPTIHPD